MPTKSIGLSGFATDGAWHIEPDANNNAKITWDRTRYRPNVVIHDWPLISSDGTAEVDHLLERFLFNDDAANSTITASTGNDATWEESDGTGRNTDNDSVSTDIFRDKGLDTKDTYHTDCDITVYTNAVFKEGTILLSFTPQFAYDDLADQTLFHMRIDANDYIKLVYDAGNARYELRVSYNGSEVVINDSAYTSNNDLQQPTRLMASWSQNKTQFFLVKNGQIVDNGINAAAASGNNPAYMYIGAESDGDGTSSLNSDIYLDEYKLFDDCILPYGAHHIGNGEGLLDDINEPHKDLSWYFDGQAALAKGGTDLGDNDNPTSGGTSQFAATSPIVGTNVWDSNGTGNVLTVADTAEDIIDYNKGFIALWFNIQTAIIGGEYLIDVRDTDGSDRISAVFDAAGNIDILYRSESTDATITGNIVCAASVWHYLKITWDDTGSIYSYINGVENGTAGTITKVWTGGDGLTWYFSEDYNDANGCDVFIGKITMGKKQNTPEIWTNFGKPLWLPLLEVA